MEVPLWFTETVFELRIFHIFLLLWSIHWFSIFNNTPGAGRLSLALHSRMQPKHFLSKPRITSKLYAWKDRLLDKKCCGVKDVIPKIKNMVRTIEIWKLNSWARSHKNLNFLPLSREFLSIDDRWRPKRVFRPRQRCYGNPQQTSIHYSIFSTFFNFQLFFEAFSLFWIFLLFYFQKTC